MREKLILTIIAGTSICAGTIAVLYSKLAIHKHLDKGYIQGYNDGLLDGEFHGSIKSYDNLFNKAYKKGYYEGIDMGIKTADTKTID